jgi:hypothetical protein
MVITLEVFPESTHETVILGGAARLQDIFGEKQLDRVTGWIDR